MPLDSLARTFWVCAAVAGKGTLLTNVTPIAVTPASGSPAFSVRPRKYDGVEQDDSSHGDMKADGPGEGASPVVVFEKYLSVSRHFLPKAE